MEYICLTIAAIAVSCYLKQRAQIQRIAMVVLDLKTDVIHLKHWQSAVQDRDNRKIQA